jgi:hypothetical protein
MATRRAPKLKKRVHKRTTRVGKKQRGGTHKANLLMAGYAQQRRLDEQARAAAQRNHNEIINAQQRRAMAARLHSISPEDKLRKKLLSEENIEIIRDIDKAANHNLKVTIADATNYILNNTMADEIVILNRVKEIEFRKFLGFNSDRERDDFLRYYLNNPDKVGVRR